MFDDIINEKKKLRRLEPPQEFNKKDPNPLGYGYLCSSCGGSCSDKHAFLLRDPVSGIYYVCRKCVENKLHIVDDLI